MASDWIKWRKGLTKRREVIRMASGHLSGSGADCRRIAVACMEFWEWLDDETTNGVIEGVGSAAIDQLVGLPGFYAAMIDVGWIIEVGANSIAIPNFDRHNGSTAKSRALDAKLKATKRATGPKPDICPDAGRTSAGPEKRRIEERREDLENGERAASGDPPAKAKKPIGITAEAFVAVWRDAGHDQDVLAAAAEFHAHRVAMRKPITQMGATKLVAQCKGYSSAEIIADITRAIASGYQGLRPTRIVTPQAKKTSREEEIAAQMARVKAKMGLTA